MSIRCIAAVAAEGATRSQLYRAWLVWDRDAGRRHYGIGSWSEWGTAGACRLA
ncbi:MAG TPA: hypothetical protein VN085_05515 [Vicinamibacterales bacterium]|nr:hypothetical protein [Vicinamibacterales bacterium]